MLSELHLAARAAAQSAQDAARSTAQRAAAGTAAAATAASSAATAATVALLTKEEAAPVVGASGTIDVSAMDRAELERLVGQLSGVQAQLHAQVRRARAALKDSQAREQAAQSQLELARQATTLATEDAERAERSRTAAMDELEACRERKGADCSDFLLLILQTSLDDLDQVFKMR